MYDENDHPIGHSMNHYSPGAVCSFLYRHVCGIQIEKESCFVIEPVPGGTLTHAKAEYLSPYGKVVSAWERNDEKTIYRVEVPANCEALLKLPDGTKKTLQAGTHEFTA